MKSDRIFLTNPVPVDLEAWSPDIRHWAGKAALCCLPLAKWGAAVYGGGGPHGPLVLTRAS